jgi:lipopolysaccharide biosynthesis protein
MVRRDVPDAVVFGVRNLGRDVVPFLQVLRAVGVDRYRYLLKLHSKKSAHVRAGDPRLLGGGDSWRRQAIAELAGSRSRLQQLLGMMDAEPSIGMVAAKGHLLEQGTWVGATGNLMACLHHRLGIAPAADVFPAGTMFWVRPSAIAKLVDLAPGLLDFEREAGQIDGTLHHALERSLAHLAVAAGYRVTDTSALSV